MSDNSEERAALVREADGEEHLGCSDGLMEAYHVARLVDAAHITNTEAVQRAFSKVHGHVRCHAGPPRGDQPIKD